MGSYELDQLNRLPQDDFYKIKVVCGFKEGETKVLNISPIEFKKLKEIF